MRKLINSPAWTAQIDARLLMRPPPKLSSRVLDTGLAKSVFSTFNLREMNAAKVVLWDLDMDESEKKMMEEDRKGWLVSN